MPEIVDGILLRTCYTFDPLHFEIKQLFEKYITFIQ